PAYKDKTYFALNIGNFIISCLILFIINWVFMAFFLCFSIIINYIIYPKIVCKKCIYKLEVDFESIEEYNERFGKSFNLRMKIIIPFLLFNWFIAFFVGFFFILFTFYINFPKTLIISTAMFIQIPLTQKLIARIPRKHCNQCIFREFCILPQIYKKAKERRIKE
ncbi:MAG: hypothetical protein ACTSQG_07020, partial [Promethearchaeota archaeon]